tara:strand:+ start:4586 stop:5272 length:687 start_codon:yes stop_codon:yes gene_type:complete
MVNYIVLRGHIYADVNPLSLAWSKKGSRLFPKAMVSNAENILRFLSLGFNPEINHAQNILSALNNENPKQKPYLLQVSIDPDQHHFLYNTLSPIKTDEGRLQELLRIHDMWVLFFGSHIYTDNPVKKLLNSSSHHFKWSLVATTSSSPDDSGATSTALKDVTNHNETPNRENLKNVANQKKAKEDNQADIREPSAVSSKSEASAAVVHAATKKTHGESNNLLDGIIKS